MARRNWKKFVLITLLIIIVVLSLGITFTIGWRPFIGAKKRALTDRKFEATPQRLARGKYLVDGVLGCFGCHSDPDWSRQGAPPIAGREGAGHIWSDQDLPWLVAPNITPDKKANALVVTARAKTVGQTGVEMEALTAVSVACLTIYDMLKASDRGMVIEGITLLEKSGGASGDYKRSSGS